MGQAKDVLKRSCCSYTGAEKQMWKNKRNAKKLEMEKKKKKV